MACHKKIFTASKSTTGKSLSAQMPQKRTASLSMKTVVLSTMTRLSHDLSNRGESLAARAKGCIQRLAIVVSIHFLPRREMITLAKRRNGSPSPMAPADSGRLKKRVLTKPVLPDFWMPPATPPRKQSRKSGRGENYRRMTAVTEPEKQKGVRFEKLRSAQKAWKRSLPSASTGLRIWRLPPKRRKPRHGQSEESVSETMAVGCEMGRYPFQVHMLADIKRNSRQPRARWDEDLDSHDSVLVCLLYSAVINKKHRTNNFFTVEKVKFLREMAWDRGAYQYSK